MNRHSWPSVTLGELGSWVGGGTPSKSVAAYWQDGSIPWVSPKDMKTEVIEASIDTITERAVAESTTQLIPAESVLVVTRSGILSHTLPVATNKVAVTLNQDLKALIPHPGVNARFVAHYLRANERNILDSCSKSGTTVASVGTEKLLKFSIPLPSTKAQGDVVKAIDRLLSRARTAREALEAIPPLIEKFRQSILAAAFRGDLTADWRAKNPDVEHASLLLDRVRTERRKKWEEAELAKLKARGKTPTDDRWKSKYEAPAPVDPTGLPDLPEGWEWLRIADIGFVRGGKRLPAGHDYSPTPTQYPYLRVTDFQHASIDTSDLKYLTAETHDALSHYRVFSDDAFISIAGSIGITGTVPSEVSGAVLTENAARIELVPSLTARFLALYLSAPIAQSQIVERTIATTMSKLALFRIAGVFVPIPPLREQKEIVKQIETMHVAMQATLRLVESSTSRLDELESSILAKAFRGELVPQDPNDEPASVLLERIRAERENAPGPNRRPRAGGTPDNSPGRSPGKTKARINPSPGGAIDPDTRETLNRPSGTRDDRSSEDPGLRPGLRSSAPPALDHTTEHAEREDRPRASIDDYTLEDILAAFRHAMPAASRYDRDDVIRAVARHLGFDRAGSRIRDAIESALPTAARRHIACYSGTEVWIATRTITDYTRDELKDYFLAAIGSTWHDRPEAIRLATRYLGFTRTGPTIEDTWKSLINGLIRTGDLNRSGTSIRRAASN